MLSRAKMKLKIIAGLEQCICSDLQDLRIDILQILRLCTKAITGRPWHENETKERRYLLVCYTETSQNTALPVQIEDTHSTWPGSVLFNTAVFRTGNKSNRKLWHFELLSAISTVGILNNCSVIILALQIFRLTMTGDPCWQVFSSPCIADIQSFRLTMTRDHCKYIPANSHVRTTVTSIT